MEPTVPLTRLYTIIFQVSPQDWLPRSVQNMSTSSSWLGKFGAYCWFNWRRTDRRCRFFSIHWARSSLVFLLQVRADPGKKLNAFRDFPTTTGTWKQRAPQITAPWPLQVWWLGLIYTPLTFSSSESYKALCPPTLQALSWPLSFSLFMADVLSAQNQSS